MRILYSPLTSHKTNCRSERQWRHANERPPRMLLKPLAMPPTECLLDWPVWASVVE